MALVAPEGFVEGSAEPWIVDVLCALLRASDQHSVLETGAFVGATTARLAATLGTMGGGTLVGCELDPMRAQLAQERLEKEEPGCAWKIVQDDILRYLSSVPNESIGFVWLDDSHEKQHVSDELHALIPKMVRGGLVCGHDVFGVCELAEVFKAFGGYSLDLPRLGPAGGLGLLQI